MVYDTAEKLPPLIDLHLHAGWTDFDHDVQSGRSAEEIRGRMLQFLTAYRKAGIITVRDAGGYPEPIFRVESAVRNEELIPAGMIPAGVIPEILPNTAMLNGESIRDVQTLAAVEASPYAWTKIFITGGVGVSPEEVIKPNGTKENFMALVHWLKERGKKVMVHCYGGAALDWCIEAGVSSVEHAVYMTKEQAERLAEKKMAVIPTTAIYRLLSEKPELFGLPKGHFISENAKYAAEGHLKSVGFAKEAGVLIGYGTDFYSDPVLLPFARYELETLQDCGLSKAEALRTGTENAEKILEKS